MSDDLGFARGLVFYTQASQISFTRYYFSSSLNFWLFTNRPYVPFGYTSSGQSGYITPAVWEVPNTSQRGRKLEVAHKWVDWLHNHCRLGFPNA